MNNNSMSMINTMQCIEKQGVASTANHGSKSTMLEQRLMNVRTVCLCWIIVLYVFQSSLDWLFAFAWFYFLWLFQFYEQKRPLVIVNPLCAVVYYVLQQYSMWIHPSVWGRFHAVPSAYPHLTKLKSKQPKSKQKQKKQLTNQEHIKNTTPSD